MKKQFLTLIVFAIFTTVSFAQVGINSDNSAPHPSAQLDIKSSDKGLLIPRMTTIERNAIQNPEIGLMVFDKDLQEIFIFNSDGWKQGTMSKLPLELTGNKLNILKVINTKTDSYPTGSTAAEFKTNDILGIAIKAESSSNLPTIDARNNSGTAIEAVSNFGLAGAFSSNTGTAILGTTGNNNAISGSNNSNTIPTAKFTNNGTGRALELIGNASIKANSLNSLYIENNKPFNIGGIDDEAAGAFINNSPFGKGISSRTTNNGTAIYAQAHGTGNGISAQSNSGTGISGTSTTGNGGFFFSQFNNAIQGYSINKSAIDMNNASLNYPTVKFSNLLNGGTALEINGNIALNGKILNEAYQTPTFENSWTNFGGEWNTAKFYKGKDGRVYLEGVVTGGSSSVICTLPVGYRPANRIFFMVSHDGNGRGRIDIQANGIVSFDYGANRTQVGLDGISFRVD